MTGQTIAIKNFIYGEGDLTGLAGASMPVVKQGGKLTFDNDDAPASVSGVGQPSGGNLPIYHTITACKAPCTKSTGIAYPLADGKTTFDSGELGYGGPPAAGRNTWQTPRDLKPGTYTYFCRIHPFMRGAFRVVKLKGT
jgi:plastocyanin